MREAISRFLYYTGLFRLWYFSQSKSITFLMLHGVMDSEEPTAQWKPFRSYISPRILDATLSILSRYLTFISIETATKLLEGQLPFKSRHYCVLTFDDGLRNNLTHAMPVLRQHNCPAAMYLVTDQIDRQEPFWFDRLDYALQQGAKLVGEIEVFGKPITLQHGSPSQLKQSFLLIKKTAFESDKTSTEAHQEILRITLQLEESCGKSLLDIYDNDPWSRVVTWEDVESAASSKDILFGSHTVDHSLLGKLPPDEIDYQLQQSKAALDQHLPYSCIHFCYPNGSVPKDASSHLSRAGYETAVTTQHGKTRSLDFDKYHIKRYNFPPMDNAVRTAARILGMRL